MYKVVILIQKRADWTHEEFVEYWRTEHVPKASEMPHVRKYTTGVILDDDAAFDGIAELYFEERDHVEASFESPAGQRTLEDAEHFTNHHETVKYIVDTMTHVDDIE